MRKISDRGGPFIIAEIGVNHCGSSTVSEFLIRAAVRAGADAVKFQGFTPDALEPPGQRRDFLRSVHIPRTRMARLRSYARDLGVEFGLSVFDPDWAFWADSMHCDFIKIASGNLTNKDLMEALPVETPVVISTGTHNVLEVHRAVEFLEPLVSHLTILKCTSAYPTPVEHCNVRGMEWIECIKKRDITKVGYSCHCPSIYPAVAAAALGAQVIEKHIALETTGGGDNASSLTPERFAEMTVGVREAYFARGTNEIKAEVVEQAVMDVLQARREWREKQKLLS